VTVFVDEVGFSFRAKTGTTWAPRGHTPVLRRVSKRRELSTLVGLTVSSKLYKRHFEHAIHGEDVVIALRHIKRHIPGPMILIWDRLNAHRAKVVKKYLALHPEILVEWLPAYAPELNPEEVCHGNVKQHLQNSVPETVSEIRRQVDRGFARLRHRPDLLLSFFEHAGLM
jgi:transposase